MEPIKPFAQGDDISAERFNEMVARLNALGKMQFGPEGIGEVRYADANVMLVLNSVPFVEAVENGVLSTYLVAKRTGPA